MRLAEVGADIAIGYEHKEQAAQVLAAHIHQMGRHARAVHADLSKPAQVHALVDVAVRELGPIDILISNAGMGNRKRLERYSEALSHETHVTVRGIAWDRRADSEKGSMLATTALEELTLEEWDQTMQVNLRAAFLLAQRITPAMRERGWGRVIFISSEAAFTGGIIGPHYAASKAGLLGLTHSLAASLAPHGVTVNAVAPALIADTGMIPGGPDAERNLVPRIPVGRLGKPEDVVEAIMMLVVNSYMTNQTLVVDGGMYPH